MHQTKVFAHRGFSAIAPENTIIAFEKAIEAEADGIELDIHMTRDGELVVIHDERVDRTSNGSGCVKNLTLMEMKQLDNGSWFSPRYKGQTFPTLIEVLDIFRDVDIQINIELKNNRIYYPKMEERVVKAVADFQMEDRVILSSFNHFSLLHLHFYRPLQLAALVRVSLKKPWVYARFLGVNAIHPLYSIVTEELVMGCHKRDIFVRPFVVNEASEWERLIKAKVDAIITNNPTLLRHIL